MFSFPVQSRDHKEPRDYLQRLTSKKIGLGSRIWAFIHECSYLSFSRWSVHASFVPRENVFCVTWGKKKNLKWASLLIWNIHCNSTRQPTCYVVYSIATEIPEQLVWVTRALCLALRICFPAKNNILKIYCFHVTLCWLNAATQCCCCASWQKTDKKETSQLNGFLFASELSFAPIPTLAQSLKKQSFTLLLTFMCVNS